MASRAADIPAHAISPMMLAGVPVGKMFFQGAPLAADSLDALLCAIQTAWAAWQPGYGLPPHADPLEGWIIDPALREQ